MEYPTNDFILLPNNVKILQSRRSTFENGALLQLSNVLSSNSSSLERELCAVISQSDILYVDYCGWLRESLKNETKWCVLADAFLFIFSSRDDEIAHKVIILSGKRIHCSGSCNSITVKSNKDPQVNEETFSARNTIERNTWLQFLEVAVKLPLDPFLSVKKLRNGSKHSKRPSLPTSVVPGESYDSVLDIKPQSKLVRTASNLKKKLFRSKSKSRKCASLKLSDFRDKKTFNGFLELYESSKWQVYWFVLSECRLYAFTSRDECSESKFFLTLHSGVKVSKLDSYKNRVSVLEVLDENSRKEIFSASSEHDSLSWLYELQNCCKSPRADEDNISTSTDFNSNADEEEIPPVFNFYQKSHMWKTSQDNWRADYKMDTGKSPGVNLTNSDYVDIFGDYSSCSSLPDILLTPVPTDDKNSNSDQVGISLSRRRSMSENDLQLYGEDGLSINNNSRENLAATDLNYALITGFVDLKRNNDENWTTYWAILRQPSILNFYSRKFSPSPHLKIDISSYRIDVLFDQGQRSIIALKYFENYDNTDLLNISFESQDERERWYEHMKLICAVRSPSYMHNNSCVYTPGRNSLPELDRPGASPPSKLTPINSDSLLDRRTQSAVALPYNHNISAPPTVQRDTSQEVRDLTKLQQNKFAIELKIEGIQRRLNAKKTHKYFIPGIRFGRSPKRSPSVGKNLLRRELENLKREHHLLNLQEKLANCSLAATSLTDLSRPRVSSFNCSPATSGESTQSTYFNDKPRNSWSPGSNSNGKVADLLKSYLKEEMKKYKSTKNETGWEGISKEAKQSIQAFEQLIFDTFKE